MPQRCYFKEPEKYEAEPLLQLEDQPQGEASEVDGREDISPQGRQACWAAAMAALLKEYYCLYWISLDYVNKRKKNGLSGNTVDENGNKSDNQKRRQRTQEALCTTRSV